MSDGVKTNWYENIEQGTFHEVVAGSDTERRIKREMRQVGDDENDVEPAYRAVTASKLPAASKQPGFVADGNVPASPAGVHTPAHPQTHAGRTAPAEGAE